MIDLKGYETAATVMPGEFSKLPAGGYICRIINAHITNSKAGNPMLVLFTDIADGEFKNFFKTAADRVKAFYSETKWDNSAVYRQLVFATDGNVSRFFKGLLTCFEKSNQSFKFNPRAFDEQKLNGLLIGFVFAEEEYFRRDGSVGNRVVIKFPRTVDDIRNNNFSVPELKRINTSTAAPSNDDFQGTPVNDLDVPF